MAPALAWVSQETKHQQTLGGLGISGHWGDPGSRVAVIPTLATMAVYEMEGLAPTPHFLGSLSLPMAQGVPSSCSHVWGFPAWGRGDSSVLLSCAMELHGCQLLCQVTGEC